jgi:putative hydrolase of the HAD superfamily
MSRPTAVLFDLDDTLLDHGAAMRKAVACVHESFAIATPLDSFREKWSDASERCYPRYLANEISFAEQRRARVRAAIGHPLSDREVDEIVSVYVAEYERSWTMFDDVLPCLESLAAFRLGVLSNGAASEQRRKLSSLGLLPRFDAVLTSEEAGAAKPVPLVFHLACEALRVAPAEAIHVGDRFDLDAVAAQRAGLGGVWLNRRREALPVAEKIWIIAGLEKLAPLLKDWSGNSRTP